MLSILEVSSSDDSCRDVFFGEIRGLGGELNFFQAPSWNALDDLENPRRCTFKLRQGQRGQHEGVQPLTEPLEQLRGWDANSSSKQPPMAEVSV